jgi:ribosomal protein S18 acetylase RimI-like enzyme
MSFDRNQLKFQRLDAWTATLANQLIPLYQTCFKEKPYEEEWDAETVASMFDFYCAATCYVAIYRDLVVGFCCGNAFHLLEGADKELYDFMMKADTELPFSLKSTFYISELGVAGEYRMLHIGSQMVSILEAEARDAGFESMFLITADAERSRQFYGKCGYTALDFTYPRPGEKVSEKLIFYRHL